MDTVHEIDRLWDSGVSFSISMGPKGYIAQLGNYAKEVTPRLETASLEDAINWVRAHVALRAAGLPFGR